MCHRPLLSSALLLLLAAHLTAPRALPAGRNPPAPPSVQLGAVAKTVAQWNLLELTLPVQAAFDNPFRAEDVAVDLQVATPGGARWTVPAFYYQPVERKPIARGGGRADWLYPTGPAQWRARLTPTEPGTYTLTATVRDRHGTASSQPATLTCTAAEGKGFLRVSRTDPRYFEFSGGGPFFAVGQNIAFIRSSYAAEQRFAKFAAAGGNYVRVWACCEDWAMGIEARKSAWGRSWSWRPPIAPSPDKEGYHLDRKCVLIAGAKGKSVTVDPCHPVALKPGTKYVLRGSVLTTTETALTVSAAALTDAKPIGPTRKWTPFELPFVAGGNQQWLGRMSLSITADGSAWIRQLSLKEAGGGPELLWEADVNRPPRGYYNQVDCLILDELLRSAERHGIYLQLCLLTRDHYMAHLTDPASPAYARALADAKNLLRYAAGRWGYSTHLATWEYFNELDPGKPMDRFYDECAATLKQVDPYGHMRATSAWRSNPKDWGRASLSVADEHYYMRPSTKELYKDAVASVLDRARLLRSTAAAKPALVSEFGVLNDNWNPIVDLKRDTGYLHHHNALWASALSGLSGTVMHWLWDDIHKRDLYHNYRGVAAFVKDIPYNTARLTPARAKVSDAGLRLVGLQGADRAYLWLADKNAVWWTLPLRGARKQYKAVFVDVAGLARGAYRVEWWDTRQGKPIAAGKAVAAGLGVKLTAPAFAGDIACKIVPAR